MKESLRVCGVAWLSAGWMVVAITTAIVGSCELATVPELLLYNACWWVAFAMTGLAFVGEGCRTALERRFTIAPSRLSLALAVLASGITVVVIHLLVLSKLHAGLLASDLAKARLTLAGRLEVLNSLIEQGLWLYLAMLSAWAFLALRSPLLSSRRWLLGLGSLLAVASGTTLFVALTRYVRGLQSLDPLETAGFLEFLRQVRPLGYYFAGVAAGLVIAGALWIGASARLLMGWPSWGFKLALGGLLAGAALLTWQTERLALENAHAFPVDVAFANLTLSILPQPGPQILAPDSPRGPPYLEIGYPNSYPKYELGSVVNALQDEESLRRQFAPDQKAPTHLSITVAPQVPVLVLRAWLARLSLVTRSIDFNTHQRHSRQTPLFKNRAGISWHSIRVHLAATPNQCPQDASQVSLLSYTSTLSLLEDLANQRLSGQEICIVPVGGCSTSSKYKLDRCVSLLSTPVTRSKVQSPVKGVETFTIAVASQEFDVVVTRLPLNVEMTGADAEGQSIAARVQQLSAEGKQIQMVMNGGMYHPGYAPVGLLVSKNELVSPLNTSKGQGNFFLQPNGVFGLTRRIDGSLVAQILTTEESSERLLEYQRQLDNAAFWGESPVGNGSSSLFAYATQSGPLLVTEGVPTYVLDENSTSRAVRNGVGIRKAHWRDADTHNSESSVVFVISKERVSFFEMARAFVVLGCDEALYLDGNVSEMYAPSLGREKTSRLLGPLISLSTQ